MNVHFKQAFLSLVTAVLFSVPALAVEHDTATNLSTAATGSGKEQLKAIDHLGMQHEHATTVVPKLRELLQSDDPQVRWHSARSLGEYGDLANAAAGELVALLKDKDPVVQYHAAIALGKVGDKSDATVAALVGAATNQDSRVARASIAALRSLKPGPERVTAALKEALKSNDQSVSVYALEAIVEQGAQSVPLLKETLKQPETAYLACAAIEQIGPEAADTVPELTQLLQTTKHSQLLIQSLLALASIGPKAQSAESTILPHLEMATDATVPVAAAYALGSIGAKDADAALKKALAKDDPFLHMVATWALAKAHPEDQEMMKAAVDALTKGLADERPQMRTAAARGLQMLQPPPELVAPALMAIANDPDPDVSANIVTALAGLGESAVPRAAKALQNPQVRPLALRVLAQMGPKAAGSVDALIALAKDAAPDLRGKIHFTLAAIGPAAAPATELLAEAIASDDKVVSESALYALREIGPGAKDAIKPLVRKMEADQSFDSLASAWALSRIATGDEAIAKQVLPVLLRGLADADEQTRLNSVDALAGWGSLAAPAHAELKKAVHEDKSPVVRAAAKAALKESGSATGP